MLRKLSRFWSVFICLSVSTALFNAQAATPLAPGEIIFVDKEIPAPGQTSTHGLIKMNFSNGVVLGFLGDGGGYINYGTWSDDPAVEGENFVAGNFGRGWQVTLRDAAHSGRYNPTQAGISEKIGVHANLNVKLGGNLLKIEPFRVPLYLDNYFFDFIQNEPQWTTNITKNLYDWDPNDNGNSDTDGLSPTDPSNPDGKTFQEEDSSEFTFSGNYQNLSQLAGPDNTQDIAILRTKYTFAYSENPAAIKQFSNPEAAFPLRNDQHEIIYDKNNHPITTKVFKDEYLWDKDLSPSIDRRQLPTKNDLSIIYQVDGIRLLNGGAAGKACNPSKRPYFFWKEKDENGKYKYKEHSVCDVDTGNTDDNRAEFSKSMKAHDSLSTSDPSLVNIFTDPPTSTTAASNASLAVANVPRITTPALQIKYQTKYRCLFEDAQNKRIALNDGSIVPMCPSPSTPDPTKPEIERMINWRNENNLHIYRLSGPTVCPGATANDHSSCGKFVGYYTPVTRINQYSVIAFEQLSKRVLYEEDRNLMNIIEAQHVVVEQNAFLFTKILTGLMAPDKLGGVLAAYDSGVTDTTKKFIQAGDTRFAEAIRQETYLIFGKSLKQITSAVGLITTALENRDAAMMRRPCTSATAYLNARALPKLKAEYTNEPLPAKKELIIKRDFKQAGQFIAGICMPSIISRFDY